MKPGRHSKPARARGDPAATPGLLVLRKAGRLTEILFLHEVATRTYGRLQPIAERLGVSVQAASFLYRRLKREGKVDLVAGRYRATMAGIDDLHHALSTLRSDVEDRMAQLQVVQKCRAIARGPIAKGDPVVLFMEGGLLHARAGLTGPSRGLATRTAQDGDLLEVDRLSGILSLTPAPVRCLVVQTTSGPRADDAADRRKLSQLLSEKPHGLLAAEGLEAVHLLRKVVHENFVRFGVAAAVRDAALLGVPVQVVVTDERLPPLLHRLSEPWPPLSVEIQMVSSG